MKNSAVRTGRIGELITMAALEKMNVDTVHHPTEGFDLVAFPGQHIVRIEVKAATTLEEQRQQYSFIAGKGKEKRIIDLSDCDIIAFVAVDLNRVYFKSVHDLKTVRNRVDRVSFMLEQESSFGKAIVKHAASLYHRSNSKWVCSHCGLSSADVSTGGGVHHSEGEGVKLRDGADPV